MAMRLLSAVPVRGGYGLVRPIELPEYRGKTDLSEGSCSTRRVIPFAASSASTREIREDVDACETTRVQLVASIMAHNA